MSNREQKPLQLGPMGPVHCITRKNPTNMPSGLHSPTASNDLRSNPTFVLSRMAESGNAFNPAAHSPKVPPMQTSVQFVNDDLELTDFIAQHLREFSDFTVIGGIGLTNCGKSTLMSMLAGNQPRDKYRQYVFRPSASRETIESGFFQTNGLHVFVSSETRTIFIDSKPFNSGAVFEDHVRKAKAENKAIYKDVQTEAMVLLSFLFEICHSVVFCVDWFIDINAVHEILRASVFSEFNFRKYTSFPKTTNLIVVHHRALQKDYEMHVVKERAQMLRSMFADSRWNVLGGISMKNLGFSEYAACEPEVNYVIMDELPQWSKDAWDEIKPLACPYGYVLERLRPALLNLKKPPFRSLDQLRPARRSQRKEKTLNLPPTLDSKDAAKLCDQHFAKQKKAAVLKTDPNKPNDETEDDPTNRGGFDAEVMPNITTRQEDVQIREGWNEQLGLSDMSLPSAESAMKALTLLRTTTVEKEDEYVSSLLPPAIDDVADFNEREWYEYVRRVFEITRRTYNTKYFLSSNGRLVPRIIRKLRSSTKLLYAAAPPAKSKRRGRGKANRNDDPTETEVATATEELRVQEGSQEPSIREEEEDGRQRISPQYAEQEEEEEATSDSSFVLSSHSSSEEDEDGDEQKDLRSSQSDADSTDSSEESGEEEKADRKTTREPLQRRRRIASDNEDEDDEN